MANQEKPSKLRAILGDTVADQIGKFSESTGGGTPIPKNEKLKDHPEAKRVQQPRDEDGQFTYNAVNNIPLKYPSRGETIPPLLKNFNFDAVMQEGKITTIYNGKRYQFHFDGDLDKFIRTFQQYNGKDGIEGLEKEKVDTKKGRMSKVEKQMIQSGKDGIVILPNGAKADPEAVKNFISRYHKEHGEFYTKNRVGKLKEEYFNRKGGPDDPNNPGGPNNPNNPGGPGGPGGPNNPNGPTGGSSGQKFDSNLAKTNPKEFANKYETEISSILKEIPELTASDVIKLVSGGYVTSMDDLKDILGE